MTEGWSRQEVLGTLETSLGYTHSLIDCIPAFMRMLSRSLASSEPVATRDKREIGAGTEVSTTAFLTLSVYRLFASTLTRLGDFF